MARLLSRFSDYQIKFVVVHDVKDHHVVSPAPQQSQAATAAASGSAVNVVVSISDRSMP